MSKLKPCPKTIEQAIRILHPDTTLDALTEIEYYAGFNGLQAKVDAYNEACVVACEVMQRELDRRTQPNNVRCDHYNGDGGCCADSCHKQTDTGDCAASGKIDRTNPNEPLTIDDIKTLDYEPIWVEDISGCYTSCWAIAGRQRSKGIELYDEHCGEHYIDFAAWENYGKTWVAYKRKPEGGEG